ncbi:hypothetical protein [Paenibacillus sp. 1P03SA]|uniref:hypothetical protein n=1 Tax=Paenibacillus sp. 1P03SA TaxID=3132294 RepID=UPI0039A377DB
MKTGSKMLPVEIPPIHGRMYYAFPLSILGPADSYMPWMLNNFIQLQAYSLTRTREEQAAEIRFYNADEPSCFSEVLTIVPEAAGKEQDIHRQAVEAIDRGQYVYAYVDKYFVADNPFYGKKHVVQEALIYGYDLEEQTFQILGFNKSRLFASSIVPFADIAKGIIHSPVTDVFLLKPREDFKPEFQLDKVIPLLTQYVDSADKHTGAALPERSRLVFGLDVYKSAVESLRCILDREGAVVTNIAYLHILWEHKKVMGVRLQYMQDHGIAVHSGLDIVQEAYGLMEQELFNLRNKLLKYELTQSARLIEQIIQSLDAMALKEKQVLELWLERLAMIPG